MTPTDQTPADRELAILMARIRRCDPATRHRYHRELRLLLSRFPHSDARVPTGLRSLECELAAEAAEARFDNMPV